MKKSIALVVLLVLVLFACAVRPSAASSGTAGKMAEYVGEIPGTDLFAALAVGSSGEVLAYVCNGMGSEYLFHGSLQKEAVSLTSDDGQARLEAGLKGSAYAGTFSAGGKTYSFTAEPVKDYGGLYRVKGLSEFEGEGLSQGGAVLKMKLTPDKERLQAAVTTPDGNILRFDRSWPADHDHRAATEYSESWVIFLNDGRAHGGHIKSSLKSGVRHIDPICPP